MAMTVKLESSRLSIYRFGLAQLRELVHRKLAIDRTCVSSAIADGR